MFVREGTDLIMMLVFVSEAAERKPATCYAVTPAAFP